MIDRNEYIDRINAVLDKALDRADGDGHREQLRELKQEFNGRNLKGVMIPVPHCEECGFITAYAVGHGDADTCDTCNGPVTMEIVDPARFRDAAENTVTITSPDDIYVSSDAFVDDNTENGCWVNSSVFVNYTDLNE